MARDFEDCLLLHISYVCTMSNPWAEWFTDHAHAGRDFDECLLLYISKIKPLESRLEIYWETSTCGLISELNRLIELGETAEEELPDEPEVPEEETEESEGGSEEGSEEGGEESVEEGGEETEENTEEEAEGNEQSSGKPANEGPES